MKKIMQIQVENIKCGGCANSIKKELKAKFNTKEIEVDIENGVIDIVVDENQKSELAEVLARLGYPQVGDNSLGKKAKSFVSCAIGRMSDDS
jgi:copper chaperone